MAPGALSIASRPLSSQLRRAITGRPIARAKPISEERPLLAADRNHGIAGGDDRATASASAHVSDPSSQLPEPMTAT